MQMQFTWRIERPPVPRTPRPPRSPTAPRPPAVPSLRLTRYRGARSVDLDGAQVRPRGEEPQPVPPFLRWGEFVQFLYGHWEAGEHLSIVGQTGSGKTVLETELVPAVRDWIVVLGTKRADASLYAPLEAKGFRMVDDLELRQAPGPRLIYRIPLRGTSVQAEEDQKERIRRLLVDAYNEPGWCLVLDEVGYLSKDLKLDRELNRLWREGRSAGTTVVALTQRPVNVPRNMWEMATHTLGFRITGREDRLTASEYLGDLRGVAFETFARLDRFEFLYCDAIESVALRSKVERPARAARAEESAATPQSTIR